MQPTFQTPALRFVRREDHEPWSILGSSLHRSNILEKLGMHNRVEITRYAIRLGLIEP